MALDFTLIAEGKCRVGESPLYDERTNRLYFVDILEKTVFGVDLASGERTSWTFESEVGSIGLAASGRLVVALRHSVILFDLVSGARQELCEIEAERGATTRLNDGRVGPDGAFWVGSMDDRKDKEPIGSLYRVDFSGRAEKKVDGLQISNGLAWTADGERMFHADTRGPWIDRWRFDRTSGAITDRTRFAAPDEVGRPDGGSCDAEGFYWSAGVSAGRLNRFAPDGGLVELLSRASRSADHAMLRRAGFPHALPDQSARGPGRGCPRQGALDRQRYRSACAGGGFPRLALSRHVAEWRHSALAVPVGAAGEGWTAGTPSLRLLKPCRSGAGRGEARETTRTRAR